MPISPLTTCLWFDGQAEEAAQLYTSVFPNSRITHRQHYTGVAQDVHGQQPGSLMVIEFSLDGHKFVGLNGGPMFKHSEAVSFMVDCDDQAEIDHYWEKLGEGGDPNRRQCGWLADKFGVAWQVIPKALKEMMSSDDKEAAGRVTAAMMQMKKMELAELRKAFEEK
ncbi:Glyoxalase/Bleomycin resistance protein/Dihydroxybiphenyl dioxygenase [Plectosphaerella plurivora]|uniref:Glyoxalase/Bleomycin resistance protein/Dihydroxybiphenyl dioxygenase n=1 Tax=Plectosphaerella plurivora TaxID=936078 RepID=A0A9P8V1D5_9PEZI|nr:Glyoxalase/Bleomycin resistance protein/Dihydroxybiphenyl dioxygenase [Plectosphaerella plurivora]